MGQIKIELRGSFGDYTHEFSAEEGGHADCIARATEYLMAGVMPKAIQLDHALQAQGETPRIPYGCGRRPSEPPLTIAPRLGHTTPEQAIKRLHQLMGRERDAQCVKSRLAEILLEPGLTELR